MKRALLSFIITLFAASPLAAAHPAFSSYPKEMEGALEAISKLPEARPLLNKVKREGVVKVSCASRFGGQFSASWDGKERHISVTDGKSRSKGSMIQLVVFELHNANRNREIAALNRKAISGKLGKNGYVEALERIEYRNLVEACALLDKGVQRGLFPIEAKWRAPKNFKEYFRIQQNMGHSAWIARKYDHMQPIARA